MIDSRQLLAWLCSLAMLMNTMAAEMTIPIALVNCSKLPVHAAALTLDEQALTRKLGLAEGAPLIVRTLDGKALPLLHDEEDGKPVVRVLVSLPPQARLDLVAGRAAQWSATPLPTATANGALDNGIVHCAPSARGWQFAFAAERARLIEDGARRLWLQSNIEYPEREGGLEFSVYANHSGRSNRPPPRSKRRGMLRRKA
jgi:hypothetical protein